MTLSFSTKWPEGMGELTGKPNYFVEKICLSVPIELSDELDKAMIENHYRYDYDADVAFRSAPKRHTIRRDQTNRWKAGMDIHPVINNRTKDRYQFAPTLKCVRVQKFEIKFAYPHRYIYIDDVWIQNPKANELAINDGFESLEPFFRYFTNLAVPSIGTFYQKYFSGVIIHWTDLKY